MPAAHPLASLRAAGPTFAASAEAQLSALLLAHRGNVRATAAALDPPVHETTLWGWIKAWDLGDAVDKGRSVK